MKNAAPAPSILTIALQTCRRAFILVASFSAVINLLFLTIPLYLMQVFDRVLTSRSFDTLLYLTLIALAGVAQLALMEFLRSNTLVRVNAYLDGVLSPEAFERSVASSFRGRSYGHESMQDLATIRGFLSGPGIATVFDTPWSPAYVLVIFLIHPTLGWFAAAGVAAVFGLALANQFATRGALRETSAAHMRAMRRVEATGRNAEVVTAMGMLPNLAQAWAREHRQASKQSERAAARASLFTALTRFTRLMLQLGCLALGAWLVTRHEASIGAMMAAALVFNRALAPVEQMMGGWRQFALARSAYDRLRRFFGEAPPPADGMPLPEPKGRLQVERVSFAIPGTDRLVIKGVSFELEPGEALAIVGPSGAGKSTLARLMVGLDRPTVGHVRLDAADVWLWDRQDLGRWIGFVPQDVELFAGTIAENIARMGKPDPFEVTRAAKLAGVHEMILRTPKGYDTDIGESGSMLSAGQRQRIALARAVYGGPRYFVFDEPNSNLDQEGEEALVRTIQKLKENGAAIILITHRPSLVSCVDKMVVLRDGVVMMQGTRSEVLERLGRRDQQQRIAAGRNADAMPPLQAPRTAAAAASATPAATPSTPQRPLPNPPNRLRPMKVGTSNQTLEGGE